MHARAHADVQTYRYLELFSIRSDNLFTLLQQSEDGQISFPAGEEVEGKKILITLVKKSLVPLTIDLLEIYVCSEGIGLS